MSTDKISTAVLEEFVKKVRIASKSKQKEFKVPIDEAENIVYHLNIVLLHLVDKYQKTEAKAETDIISIVMDGGSLEEKR